MGWDFENDRFIYTGKILRAIAANYGRLYQDGLSFREGSCVINPWEIAEYVADFDMALNRIGGGNWASPGVDFSFYRHYDRLQLVVIADIMGIQDRVLESLGLYEIHRLRGYAYHEMCLVLNGEIDG